MKQHNLWFFELEKQPIESFCKFVKNKVMNVSLEIKKIQKELNEEKLHCSVSEDLLPLYLKIFINHFKWAIDEVQESKYKKGKLEYFFNGKSKKESEL